MVGPNTGRSSRNYQSVLGFIDWNSQLRVHGQGASLSAADLASLALSRTAARIARCLAAADCEAKFRVNLRLYHGWYKGFEQSPNRRAIVQTLAGTDFNSLSPKPNVVFSSQVKFGDCLIVAMEKRLHPHLGIHLPNTLRDRGDGVNEEKMVDTAIASDIVITAFNDPGDWIIVAAEDDDLIPPIYVAESLIQHAGSRVLLLSKRKRSRVFMKLDGIATGD